MYWQACRKTCNLCNDKVVRKVETTGSNLVAGSWRKERSTSAKVPSHPNSTVIVTFYSGPLYETIESTIRQNRQLYCDRHGYICVTPNHMQPCMPGLWEEAAYSIMEPAPWAKMVVLIRCLESNFYRVVWLDADLVIVNLDLPIEAYEAMNEDRGRKIHHAESALFFAQDKHSHFNTGMMIAHNTEMTFNLFTKALQMSKDNAVRHHPWWEQQALLLLFDETRQHSLDSAEHWAFKVIADRSNWQCFFGDDCNETSTALGIHIADAGMGLNNDESGRKKKHDLVYSTYRLVNEFHKLDPRKRVKTPTTSLPTNKCKCFTCSSNKPCFAPSCRVCGTQSNCWGSTGCWSENGCGKCAVGTKTASNWLQRIAYRAEYRPLCVLATMEANQTIRDRFRENAAKHGVYNVTFVDSVNWDSFVRVAKEQSRPFPCPGAKWHELYRMLLSAQNSCDSNWLITLNGDVEFNTNFASELQYFITYVGYSELHVGDANPKIIWITESGNRQYGLFHSSILESFSRQFSPKGGLLYTLETKYQCVADNYIDKVLQYLAIETHSVALTTANSDLECVDTGSYCLKYESYCDKADRATVTSGDGTKALLSQVPS